MAALHPAYVCECTVPVPLIHLGQDTGLCQACKGVYDDNLYEKRLREHTVGYNYDSLHDFLKEVDPKYAALG